LFATIVQLLQTRTLGNLVVGLPHSYSLQFSVQPLANAPKSQVSRSSPTKHERRGVHKSLHATSDSTLPPRESRQLANWRFHSICESEIRLPTLLRRLPGCCGRRIIAGASGRPKSGPFSPPRHETGHDGRGHG
jgi:hypothetical protein